MDADFTTVSVNRTNVPTERSLHPAIEHTAVSERQLGGRKYIRTTHRMYNELEFYMFYQVCIVN